MNISNNPISKSFIVGRPINATVSRGDVVTLNVELTDDRGNIIDLTGCTVQATTTDTESHLWATTITDAVKGKFTFTFQPLVVGKCEANAMVMKTIGEDDVTTTFYLGDISVAFEDGEPTEHIISLTHRLLLAAKAAEEATVSANTAASSANTASYRANNAATKIENASINVGTTTSGTVPLVTKRGPALNPIFDFVLVKGEKGDPGEGIYDKGLGDMAIYIMDDSTNRQHWVYDNDYALISGINIINDSVIAIDMTWSSYKLNQMIGNIEAALEALL